MITLKNKNPWPLVNEGVHEGIIVDVVAKDADEHGVAPEIRFVWELGPKDENGKHYTVTKLYSDRATISRDFAQILGEDHPLVTCEEDNLETAIGTSNRVDVEHRPKRNKELFANVNQLLPATKNPFRGSGRYVRLKDRRHGPSASAPQPRTVAPEFRPPNQEQREAA